MNRRNVKKIILIGLTAVWAIFPVFPQNAQATRYGVRLTEGERAGEYSEEPRNNGFVEDRRDSQFDQNSSGQVMTGTPRNKEFDQRAGWNANAQIRRDAAIANRELGSRVSALPPSADAMVDGDQTYYVDDGTYYLPCTDDTTSYCVVPAP